MFPGGNTTDSVSREMRMHDFLKSKTLVRRSEWAKQRIENWPIQNLVISPEAKYEMEESVSQMRHKQNVQYVFKYRQCGLVQ